MFDVYTTGVTPIRSQGAMMVVNRENVLSVKRKEILAYISDHLREHGYPPSVREIGQAVGLTSSSTVHAHLSVLEREGYIHRDPTKPRALEIRYDPSSGAAMAGATVRFVPVVGSVAAGTDVLAQENVEELLPLPEEFTGSGSLFMVKVRGESMIGAGILPGDYVVVRAQPDARDGDIVVAGIQRGSAGSGDEEGTVKTVRFREGSVVLEGANPDFAPLELDPTEVAIYGKVVTVLRRI